MTIQTKSAGYCILRDINYEKKELMLPAKNCYGFTNKSFVVMSSFGIALPQHMLNQQPEAKT